MDYTSLGGGPMPPSEIPVFIKNLIARNQVIKAIDLLKTLLRKSESRSYDLVILAESRWRDTLRREISGAFSWDELDRCKHSIKAGLLDIVNMEFDP